MGRSKPVAVNAGVGEAELALDVVANGGSGGGGEGDGARGADALADLAETAVLGAEVVSPGGDAMGFVDDEEAGLHLLHGAEEGGRVESLGRDVEESVEAVAEFVVDETLFVGGLRTVEDVGGDSEFAEVRGLVGHERDERGDDEGESALHDGGKLEAEALAGPGGHDADDIVSGEDVFDGLALGGTEGVVAEDGAECVGERKHGPKFHFSAMRRRGGSGNLRVLFALKERGPVIGGQRVSDQQK